MPGASDVPRGNSQSQQRWLDLAEQAIQINDHNLLVKAIAGLTKQSRDEDPFLLETILRCAEALKSDEDYLLRAMEALLYVADRTPCYAERWQRVKSSLIQTAILSNDPELCMETHRYIADREPQVKGEQWDMFVRDFLLPFDTDDLFDLQTLWKLEREHNRLSPEEELCRIISRAMRQSAAQAQPEARGASNVIPFRRPQRPVRAVSRVLALAA